MAQRRIFTVTEVNALLPRLNYLVGLQLERRGKLDEELQALADAVGESPPSLADKASDSESVRRAKRQVSQAIAEYKAGWDEVEHIGGVVKDSRLGLVDFYGLVDGELVWLCWKYGEGVVNHYHHLKEGFSSRKPLPEAPPAAKPN
jgi:hypothetical protein